MRAKKKPKKTKLILDLEAQIAARDELLAVAVSGLRWIEDYCDLTVHADFRKKARETRERIMGDAIFSAGTAPVSG